CKTNGRRVELMQRGEAEGDTVYEIQEAGAPFGMQTFDQALIRVCSEGAITEENALLYASHKSTVHRGIAQIKHARGEKTTDIDGLVVDRGYSKTVRKR